MNKYCKNAASLKKGAKKYFDSISLIEAVERSRYGAVKKLWLQAPTLEGLCLFLEISPARWRAILDGRYGEDMQEAALWAELVIGEFLTLELLNKAKGTDGAKLLWQQSVERLWEGEIIQSDAAASGDNLDLEGKERLLRQIFYERQ